MAAVNAKSVDGMLRVIRISEPHEVGTGPMVLRSEAKPPIPWEAGSIEPVFGVKLPQEAGLLWSRASELRLNEDLNYGQWGCILWSPAELVERHKKALDWRRPEDFHRGDVIIGEFRGDTDLVILRCDPAKSDYGKVVVALAIDPRSEWPCVASSITDFVLQYLSCPERKYWEPQ